MDLNEFQTFTVIVDTMSFSRAAETLGISKALVSKHVAHLEQSLGVKLMHRTTRRIVLTPAGVLFHERCRQLVAYAKDARNEVEQFRNEPGGRIRVSSAMSFGRRHLVPAIAQFLERYPDVSVELNLNQQFPDMFSSAADVVIRQAEEPVLLSLVARRLAQVKLLVCASPAYLARHQPPRRPEDLHEYNCLVYFANSRGEWVFTSEEGQHIVRPKGNFTANSAEAVLSAAVHGMGIAVLPEFAAADLLRAGELQRVLPSYRLPVRSLYAAYLPNPTMAHCTRLFVSFLGEYFGSKPQWDMDQS